MSTTGATQSAVLALIGEAEPVVGAHRAVLDPTAALGVGAHVTVLYPFVAPPAITAGTVETLQRVVVDAPSFSCRFTEVRWFGDEYVWLAPDPAAPFDDLTARVLRAFPDQPPYGGEHDPLPHLTLGYRRHAGLDALRDAAAAVTPMLPFSARIDRLHLLSGSRAPSSWRVVAELPLAVDSGPTVEARWRHG